MIVTSRNHLALAYGEQHHLETQLRRRASFFVPCTKEFEKHFDDESVQALPLGCKGGRASMLSRTRAAIKGSSICKSAPWMLGHCS